MQAKVKLFNTSQTWLVKKRYKVNETVSYAGNIYQNSTGRNTDPTLGTDWMFLQKLNANPTVYKDDFIDSGTHQFIVPSGVLISGVFVNYVAPSAASWSQSGVVVTVTTAITGDLVTLTGMN